MVVCIGIVSLPCSINVALWRTGQSWFSEIDIVSRSQGLGFKNNVKRLHRESQVWHVKGESVDEECRVWYDRATNRKRLLLVCSDVVLVLLVSSAIRGSL